MKATLATILLLFVASSASAQSTGKRLAVVNGDVITEDQVQKAAAQELESLELKRRQFETGWERDKGNIMENALDKIVADKLLDAEAMKRSVTREQLVTTEVADKVPVPSDAAVERFWTDNASRIDMSREQALPQIREYLLQQDRERALSDYVEKLRTEYAVQSFFEPVRTQVPIDGHPTHGPLQAPITIVEFSDFECPYCGALYPTLKDVEKNYADKVRIVYRQYPLVSIHPNAQKAAEASLCANEQQKFWELHDAMFADQRNIGVPALKEKAAQLKMNAEQFNTCLDSGKYAEAVRNDVADGTKVGVSGTPAMFVNGRFMSGSQPYQEIVKVIEDELKRASAKK